MRFFTTRVSFYNSETGRCKSPSFVYVRLCGLFFVYFIGLPRPFLRGGGLGVSYSRLEGRRVGLWDLGIE